MTEIDKQERTVSIIIFLFVVFLSAYIRLAPVLAVDFPINDGGLFAAMIESQLSSGWAIPDSVAFNGFEIPFAYPPLGFYLAAGVIKLTGWEVLKVLQFLPAILACLTVPAFYLLAKTLFKSPITIHLAALIYALVPRSWKWLIMGGGLTRSLGILFGILAVVYGYQVFTKRNKKSILLAILFTALTILSHPETGVFIVLTMILLFLVYDRNWLGFKQLVLLGAGTLITTAPWWLTVILKHGAQPLLAASKTSGFSLLFLRHFFLFGQTDEVDSHFIAGLAVLGCFLLLAKKRVFLPIWALVILVFIQRSGANYIMVPVSLIVGSFLGDIILPIINKEKSNDTINISKQQTSPLKWSAILLVGYIWISLLLSATLQPYTSGSDVTALTTSDREAMDWVSNHTPNECAFLILTEELVWDDKINEWFPYLTERQSLTTLQGTEWIAGNRFNLVLTWYMFTKDCLDGSRGCLEEKAAQYNIPFTHVYLPKQTLLNIPQHSEALIFSLRFNPDYELVYDGEGAAIFEYLGSTD